MFTVLFVFKKKLGQNDKITFLSFIVRTLFELVWLWKILLLHVKQLNGYLVPYFSGVVFTPSKPFCARKKKYLSPSFRVLPHMRDWRKSEGNTYLMFLVCWFNWFREVFWTLSLRLGLCLLYASTTNNDVTWLRFIFTSFQVISSRHSDRLDKCAFHFIYTNCQGKSIVIKWNNILFICVMFRSGILNRCWLFRNEVILKYKV